MNALNKFQYVAYEDAKKVPHVLVDSGGLVTTSLELSHWPGNRTPAQFKADTSAEIVFKFLESDSQESIQASCVSNDHYDLDGLLSVWIMTNPSVAFKHREIVEAAATTGDFDRYTNDAAAKICLSFNAAENALVKKIYPLAKTTAEFTDLLISGLLPEVEGTLLRPERNENDWGGEYAFLQKSLELIQGGKVVLTEHREIGLCVVESEIPLHPFAINANTKQSLVLYSIQEKFREMFYKYESFVDIVSYSPTKRIDWSEFLGHINRETVHGTWFMESPYTAHPSLRLYTSNNKSTPINTAYIAPMIINFLRANISNPVDVSRWYEDQSQVLPPSYREKRS